MSDAARSSEPRSRSETLSKLMSSRHRTDLENRDNQQPRNRLLGALPGVNHGHKQQQRHDVPKHKASQANDTVQSALELRPPISFDNLLRRDKKTPTPSRKNSGSNDIRGNGDLDKLQLQTRILRDGVGIDEIKQYQVDNQKREEELRIALQEIEEQSMHSTRELDNTYYILLEKAEVLRAIVKNMQKLAIEGRQLHVSFDEQSKTLQEETSTTIDGYDKFSKQESAIISLLDRLEMYKKRTSSLNDRLDEARHRAEACEQRVLDAQAQRKKRWSITWATTLSIMVLAFTILIIRHPPTLQSEVQSNSSSLDTTSSILIRMKSKRIEDPYLHDLFDGIS